MSELNDYLSEIEARLKDHGLGARALETPSKNITDLRTLLAMLYLVIQQRNGETRLIACSVEPDTRIEAYNAELAALINKGAGE